MGSSRSPTTRSVQYKVTDFWARSAEHTLAWDDPALAIRWPLPPGTTPFLSDKDRGGARSRRQRPFREWPYF